MPDVLREITQASLGRIRKTSDPPRVAVYDVIGAITIKNNDDSGKAYSIYRLTAVETVTVTVASSWLPVAGAPVAESWLLVAGCW